MGNHSKKTIPDKFKGGRHLNVIRDNHSLKIFEKAILFDLTNLCDLGEGADFQDWIWRKKEDWVKDLGFSHNILDKWIKALISKGYLLERPGYKKGRQAANEYQVTPKIFENGLIEPPQIWDPSNHRAPPDLVPLAPPDLVPIYNNAEYNNVKSAADGSDRIVLEKNKPNRVQTSVNVTNTPNHNARACMNVDGRLDEEKPSPERVKSWELSQAIFGLTKDGPEHRKEIYQWMDGLFRDYGKYALGYLDPMAKSNITWEPTKKVRQGIEKAIIKIKDESINKKRYQSADEIQDMINNC